MKTWIPRIGSTFLLEEDRAFTLYNEYRNLTFYNRLRALNLLNKKWKYEEERYNCEGDNCIIYLPKNSLLSVNRIYIRKGASDFDSVTLNFNKTSPVCKENPNYKGLHGRFWVKLIEFNNIEISVIKW